MPAKDPRVLYRHQLYKGPRARARPHAPVKPRITLAQILQWADEYFEENGDWPTTESGRVGRFVHETWNAVNCALVHGFRGLPGGDTLARLLAAKRERRHPQHPPPLTMPRILAWADSHHKRKGYWPNESSGSVPEAPGESWGIINKALIQGRRGLPGGSSLTKLLAKHRGVRNVHALPHVSVKQILAWADAHRGRTGKWPRASSGPVAGAKGENWRAIDIALRVGVRGLPGGDSLSKLLMKRRGARHRLHPPPLTIKRILALADDHFQRTGTWPNLKSGAIAAAEETWASVDSALSRGLRGLPGGTSLARLLTERRNVHAIRALPLAPDLILSWADAHHRRTGSWPAHDSGPIAGSDGEVWSAVDTALLEGGRGLKGRSSLAKLLAKRRGVRNRHSLQRLTYSRILSWADDHHRRTGEWPKRTSGPVDAAPGETWVGVQSALCAGVRGLPGGMTLARLLANHRGVRNHLALSRLTVPLVLSWAKAHYHRTGKWPTQTSGPIVDAPGENWNAVNNALARGLRGLPGGSSLVRLRETSPRNR